MRLDVGYIRSSTVPAQAASLYSDPGMATMSRGDALKLSVRLGGFYTVRAATTVPTPEVIIEYVPEANTSAIPRIEPVTHPDPDGWYNIATAELTWTLPVDITTVRTLLNGSPLSVPTKVYETPINSITLTDLDEGVSYFQIQFHLIKMMMHIPVFMNWFLTELFWHGVVRLGWGFKQMYRQK